jgi:DNA primase
LPTIKIRSHSIDVDVRAELEQYNWTRPKWSSDKLIAASPFRYDQTPSFFVNFTGEYAGCWGDSGAYDADWESGNFPKLLSFLRNESYEETEEYLLGEYGWQDESEDGNVKLIPINLRIQRARQSLSTDILAKYTEDYTYLMNRGISERVQRQMGVLYDTQQKAAVIPWRLANGVLANVKYRKTYGKTFWYAKDAWPIRQLVFGIDQAQAKTIICEAEIDAMSWMEAGYAAVAVGGASFNGWKRDIILRSPIEELLIVTDNDKAGGKLRKEIEVAMKGHVRVRQAYVRADCKDANEALMKYGVDSLATAAEQSEGVSFMYVNLRNRKD